MAASLEETGHIVRRGRTSFPFDVVEEILTRLPVKDVLRCKLLSKAYHALIKNPRFIKKHLLLHQSSPTNNQMVLVVDRNPNYILSVLSSSEVYVPDPARSNSLHLLGSCNGLLCGYMYPPGDKNTRLLLWNPATRDHTIIHDLQRPLGAVGFGYDTATGDYKLVNFRRYSPIRWVKLWTMSTNCWMDDVGDMPEFRGGFYIDLQRSYGMLLPRTNKLYWLVSAFVVSAFVPSAREAFILSFDMANDTFQQITLSSDIKSEPYVVERDLIDNMGSLALSVTKKHADNKLSFDIWVMDDNNNNGYWTKRFSVQSQWDFFYRVRFSVCDTLVLEDFSDCRFVLYDPDSKEEKEKHPCPRHQELNKPWSYTESLVPVRKNHA